MRPTGALHLGHLRGVLRNWVGFQESYTCRYMVADWHALTTDYAQPGDTARLTEDMVLCWLAAGIDPERSTLFVQSQVPEHAELHLLLSMVCPLPWLERMPTYRDQQAQLKDRDLNTYGFLGYPLLQSADILVYRAGLVPVGEDQVPHVEFSREIARRFNHVFGAGAEAGERLHAARQRAGPALADRLDELGGAFRERGDRALLEEALGLIGSAGGLGEADREALEASVRGTRRHVLPEPRVMLTKDPRVTGLDGRKMSKSYGNTIGLLEEEKEIERKVLGMPTDPARVRRADPGNPEKCPVWEFHKIYSDDAERARIWEGCTTAGIGCVECKRSVLRGLQEEIAPIRERAKEIRKEPGTVAGILRKGAEKAREAAGETMAAVRKAAGLPQ